MKLPAFELATSSHSVRHRHTEAVLRVAVLYEIDRFVRAFSYPYPGASTYLGNRRLFLKRSRIESGDKSHQFAAGLVLRKSQKELFVAAVGGTVVVKDVFGDDQKNLFDEVRVGDRLFTPAARLESAMAFKAVYTPEGPKKL